MGAVVGGSDQGKLNRVLVLRRLYLPRRTRNTMPPIMMIATASSSANLMKPPPIGSYPTQPVLARIWSATLALAIVHGQDQPVPGGIFTVGISRRITRWRRATRLAFTCGLKTVRGLGIIADRNAASRTLRFAAGL